MNKYNLAFSTHNGNNETLIYDGYINFTLSKRKDCIKFDAWYLLWVQPSQIFVAMTWKIVPTLVINNCTDHENTMYIVHMKIIPIKWTNIKW